MNIGWILCINMVIGVPAYFISCFVFWIIESMKYGSDIMEEVMDNLKKESDTVYLSWVSDPRIMYVLSFILVFMFWEIMLPMLYYKIHQEAKELYHIRN